MIPSRIKVDIDAVKKAQHEATNWTATCSVCHKELVGTICELKAHIHGSK